MWILTIILVFYKLPLFKASNTTIAGPANKIAETETNCARTCQFINPPYMLRYDYTW